MERITISPPTNRPEAEHVQERRSIAEVSRDILLDGVNRSELAKLGGVVLRRPSPPHQRIMSAISAKISSDSSHDPLQA